MVPQGLKNEILEYFHDHSYAGHMGRDNTCRNIKIGFYWYQLYADVAAHVKSCAACSRNKTTGKKRKAEMVRYHAGSPMQRVHIDILGPFTYVISWKFVKLRLPLITPRVMVKWRDIIKQLLR